MGITDNLLTVDTENAALVVLQRYLKMWTVVQVDRTGCGRSRGGDETF
jgi:hypothetical protein